MEYILNKSSENNQSSINLNNSMLNYNCPISKLEHGDEVEIFLTPTAQRTTCLTYRE